MKCCICGKEFEGYGNNPCPVVTDSSLRCCDSCNRNKVIPARLTYYQMTINLNEKVHSKGRKVNGR